LFAAMGRADLLDDSRFATNPDRLTNNEAMQEIVHDWVASMPRDEVLATLEKYEVVCAAVNDAQDIVADPHFRERTLVEVTGNDVLGRVLMPGPVLHMSSYPGPVYHGVPAIGEHTRSVLSDWLQMEAADLTRLEAAGVVKQAG
jgi:crotonobetainyl-CoA:carnitine CoA-transferase CaiB-like acyl-CoA transferase